MPMDEFRVVAQAKQRRRVPRWAWSAIFAVVAAAAAGIVISRSGAGGESEPTPVPVEVATPAKAISVASSATDVDAPAIAAALRSGDLETLETRLAELVALEAADPVRGEPLAASAFQAFDSADPELTDRLIGWRAERRGSPYAAYALARHYNQRAWRARGGKYAKDTPASAFAEYQDWRAKALPLARAAVKSEPRLVSGWRLLLDLGLGDPRVCLNVAAEAIAVLPASFRVRSALMNCLRPRWGGRYEAMEAVAREAQRHVERNPRLRWLAGYVAQDRANLAIHDKEFELAQRWVDEALEQGGPSPVVVDEQARILRHEGRLSEALAVLDRSLAEWPDEQRLLEARLYTLSKLARGSEARETFDRLAAIDPTDDDLDDWRRWFGREARASCETLSRNKAVEAAIARCREALDADPNDADSLHWLGRAYLHGGRYDDARDTFHAALRANPRHREAILNLDWIYGRSQNWQAVVELWDAYLELEPDDARAWLERAGTRRHLGQKDGSCDDLARSCELGNDDACRFRRRDC